MTNLGNNIFELVEINQTEKDIIKKIRNLQLYDKMTISYGKPGQLVWGVTTSRTGSYIINLHQRDSMI